LDIAAPLGRFAIGDEPDVGVNARIVEQLVGESDDRIEPVVLDDPTAYV
jgi:hypothetical protein